MTVSTDSLSKTESCFVKLISSKSMEVFLRLYCLYLLLLGSIFLELTHCFQNWLAGSATIKRFLPTKSENSAHDSFGGGGRPDGVILNCN